MSRMHTRYSMAAEVYDLLYAWKDYAAESRRLLGLLRGRFRPPGRRLLEVACGTGRYLEHFKDRFEVAGMDLEPGMLRVARRRLPGVALSCADMRDFDLGHRFDVVLCLFSSIGYMRNRGELCSAIRSMAAHLAPGGILVVEPWLRRQIFRPRTVHSSLEKSEAVHVSRMVVSRRRGFTSVMDMHHLVGTPDGVRHFVEHHELWMAPDAEYRAAFAAAGLTASRDPGGLTGRGLWIALRPPDRPSRARGSPFSSGRTRRTSRTHGRAGPGRSRSG